MNCYVHVIVRQCILYCICSVMLSITIKVHAFFVYILFILLLLLF